MVHANAPWATSQNASLLFVCVLFVDVSLVASNCQSESVSQFSE